MKKILSMLLAMTMVVSMFVPGAIFAAANENLALNKTASNAVDGVIEQLAGVDNPYGENLALNKETFRSSVEGGDGKYPQFESQYATDGDRTGSTYRWASNYTDNEWITVDLGQKYGVNRVVLYWENARAIDYKIQVSNDNETWTDAYHRVGLADVVETLEFDLQLARYVRMQGIDRSSAYGYSVIEFEVYGPSSTEIPVGDLTYEAGSNQSGEDISKAFDGNTDTMWHTVYSGTPRENHYAIIHLDTPALVDGLRYQPRQVGTNGNVTSYEVLVSRDNGATYESVATGTWANNTALKTATFEPQEGVTDVKFVSLASVGDHTSAAELRVTQLLDPKDFERELVGQVKSPDGTLEMNLYNGVVAGLAYDIKKDGETVTELSELGIRTTTEGNFTNNLTLTNTEAAPAPLTEAFTMVSGKQLEISETYNKTVFSFENADGNELGIEVRLFDEGVAFRYLINGEEGAASQIPQHGESTQFVFNGEAETWYHNYKADIDRAYLKSTADAVSGSVNMSLMTRPDAAKDLYALVFQVIVDASYGGTALQGDGAGGFTTRFSMHQGTTPINITLPFASPWRVVAVGTAADIAETNLAEVLAPPSVLADAEGNEPDWIQPGVSAWTWYNRDATDNLERFKQYVDLAAELGWKYVLVDEGWQNRNGGRHYSGGYGYYGITDWAKELVDYADDKGIGVLVWFHKVDLLNKDAVGNGSSNGSAGTPRTQEEITANIRQYAEAGFAGIKPDFFGSDSQAARKQVEMLTKACADTGLMINYHGVEIWPGVRRTQPHIVSIEGVFGEEQNLWDGTNHLLPTQLTMLPFIRNSIASVDYTPAYSFLSSNGSSADNARTLAASTALTVIFENGLQCLADTVEHYRDAASKKFFKNLPSAWDETKLLGGAPSDSVIMGRRSGETWYVGAISDEAQSYTLDLDFLGEGNYYASIYTDGTDEAPKYGMSESGMFGQYDGRSGIIWTDIDFEEKVVTKADSISFDMLKKGGAAIRFSKTPLTSWTKESAAIAPNPFEVEKGKTAQATLTFTETFEMELREWSVEDETIATVSQDGTVTGVNAGTTTLIAKNPNREGVQVTAEIVVLDALTLNTPWYVTTPVPEKVTYNSSASASITTDAGDWYGISDSNTAKQMRNLHLTDVSVAENMEITSELTFNAGTNYNVAGITFYLENGNMVAVERRFHSGFTGSIFALVGNTSTVGSGTAPTTFEGSPTSGRAVADTRPDAKCEIKLVKTGDVYTAYFRYFDETEWTKITESYTNTNIGSTGEFSVGLFASYGSGTASSKVAAFENFKLNGDVLPFTDYKVQFESNGGTEIRYQIADIDGTEKLEEPTPVKDGFAFEGWFTDAELTEAFDFETAVTSDLTLYAKWTEIPKEMLTATVADDKISAVLVNTTDEAISGQLIIALYDEDGRVSAVETKAFDLASGESDNLIYAVLDNQTNCKYKVFAWDASFLPLTEAVSGEVAQN